MLLCNCAAHTNCVPCCRSAKTAQEMKRLVTFSSKTQTHPSKLDQWLHNTQSPISLLQEWNLCCYDDGYYKHVEHTYQNILWQESHSNGRKSAEEIDRQNTSLQAWYTLHLSCSLLLASFPGHSQIWDWPGNEASLLHQYPHLNKRRLQSVLVSRAKSLCRKLVQLTSPLLPVKRCGVWLKASSVYVVMETSGHIYTAHQKLISPNVTLHKLGGLLAGQVWRCQEKILFHRRLAFLKNAHQNGNQKSIGSASAYTSTPAEKRRVWFRDCAGEALDEK